MGRALVNRSLSKTNTRNPNAAPFTPNRGAAAGARPATPPKGNGARPGYDSMGSGMMSAEARRRMMMARQARMKAGM